MGSWIVHKRTDSLSRFSVTKDATIGVILCVVVFLSAPDKILAAENYIVGCKTDKIRHTNNFKKGEATSYPKNLSPNHKANRTREDIELPAVAPSKNLDWIPKGALPVAQKNNVAAQCSGAYIEPLQQYPDSNLDPAIAAIEFSAKKTESLDLYRAKLEGDVQISQGYRQVRSDEAIFDQASRKVSLNGNVQFREPGLLLLGAEAKLDSYNREVQINQATYLLHESSVRGSARQLTRNQDGRILIEDATYTTCDPSDTTWQMVTNKIDINQSEGFATIERARLEVGKIPIFFFPRITFPIDQRRSSGLLFPTVHMNRRNGLDITQPIYWDLAPNLDATFIPRFISERGIALGAEVRHLSRLSKTKAISSFLLKDRQEHYYRNSIKEPSDYFEQSRYIASIHHQSGFRKPWSFLVDATKVSDKNYFLDLGDEFHSQNNLTHLNQASHFTYRNEHWIFGIRTEDYQVMSDNISKNYALLPQISANAYYRFSNFFEIDAEHIFSRFIHPQETQTQGYRHRLDYTFSWHKESLRGFFKPSFKLSYLGYALANNNIQDTNPNVTAPSFSLDAGIFFERKRTMAPKLTQTLEPRIFYVKRPFKNQSQLPDFDTQLSQPTYDLLFQDNHFIGGDRLSDLDRLSIAVTSRFIDEESGREILSASIAHAVHFNPSSINLHKYELKNGLSGFKNNDSLIALKLSSTLNSYWQINTNVIYDNQNDKFNTAYLGIRKNDKNNHALSFSYSYSNYSLPSHAMSAIQNIEQVNISNYFFFKENLNWVSKFNFDFTNHRILEVYSGLEYKSCCWSFSFLARRGLQRDDLFLFPEKDLRAENSLLFQIKFKGLAGDSGHINSILKEGIHGYGSKNSF
tara:strand:- start:258 stop:2840 length:2583 start_codon:yes stop_codon:yes gene_type:complete